MDTPFLLNAHPIDAPATDGRPHIRRVSPAVAFGQLWGTSEVEQPRRLRFVLGDGGAPHLVRGVGGHAELIGKKYDRGFERRPVAGKVYAAEGLLWPQHIRLAQRGDGGRPATR